jgi:2-polyprenyl-6-methoxyphenol hydroxylase-like FAD-dependent oxidoreductase
MIVGGSVAGLMAARVLSDRYDRVTLVDRDTFPAVGQHRRGRRVSAHNQAGTARRGDF